MPGAHCRGGGGATELEVAGYGAFDALHLSSAEAGMADVLLITDDRFIRLANRAVGSPRMRVLNPVELVEAAVSMASVEQMTDEQFERYALEVLQRELGADGLALFRLSPQNRRMFDFARKMLACGAAFQFTAFRFHNSRRSLRRQPSTLRQSVPWTKQKRAKRRIVVFRSLFRGREDVYARRWERDGKRPGYSPAAVKDWKRSTEAVRKRKRIDRRHADSSH